MAVADVWTVLSASSSTTVRRNLPFRAPVHPLSAPGWLRLASMVLALGVVSFGVVGVRAALSAGRRRTPWHSEPRRCSWAPRISTSRSPTPMPQLRPPSCAPGSNPRSYGPATWTTWRPQASSWRSSPAARPVRRSPAGYRPIARQLPVYAGQVESARTNNRLDYPLGAAYLRRASDLDAHLDAPCRHQHLRGRRPPPLRRVRVRHLADAAIGDRPGRWHGPRAVARHPAARGPPDAPDPQPRSGRRHGDVAALGARALIAFDTQQDALAAVPA